MTDVVSFTRVKLPYGWLGNMAPYAISYEGKEWRTTEALFQALRFPPDSPIREEIRAQKSPMTAKMVARSHDEFMVVVPKSLEDLCSMRLVLELKLAQHPILKEWLLTTGDAEIIEDVTARPRGSGLFWGAAKLDGIWQGHNALGRIWMKIRAEST